MTSTTVKKKVVVALSGGVDSAVAAAILQQQSFDVRGIFLREYTPGLDMGGSDSLACAQEADRASACAVAAHLEIPFEEWDFRELYQEHVVTYLFSEYARGRTPNPDVMCNKHIKFGMFFEAARATGADFIATGHYVRKKAFSSKRISGARHAMLRYALAISKDAQKDQSYFLYTLTQEQLSCCLFPLGTLKKQEVRAYAKKIGLPNWNRKDSQGVCFVGNIAMKDFLQTKLRLRSGRLMTRQGVCVGAHEGAGYYTVGQRHGIGYSGGGEPYFVVDKDMEKNILYVAQGADNPELFKRELVCESVHWIGGTQPQLPLRCKARIRYRQPVQLCTVSEHGNEQADVVFDFPQRAVTPGQSIVFYKGAEVLGGGIIA